MLNGNKLKSKYQSGSGLGKQYELLLRSCCLWLIGIVEDGGGYCSISVLVLRCFFLIYIGIILVIVCDL